MAMFLSYPTGFKFLAFPCVFIVLCIKLMALIIHSPEVKKLSLKASMAESSFEASYQLYLVILSSIISGAPSTATLVSGSSSMMMIGKSSAEAYLTFSRENKLEGTPLIQKIKYLSLYAPVFILTAIFRIGSLAVISAWSRVQLLVLIALSANCVGQVVVLAIVLRRPLSDIFRGVLAEVTNISPWANRPSEDCRNIQFATTCFYLLLYSGFLGWVIMDPAGDTLTFLRSLVEPRTQTNPRDLVTSHNSLPGCRLGCLASVFSPSILAPHLLQVINLGICHLGYLLV